MKLTIRRPDDLHVHLREGAMLQAVAPLTARHFARALVMPNLKIPITTGWAVTRYREEILAAAPGFKPLMTIKLLDGMTPETVLTAKAAGAVAAKLYPRGVTTNAEDGVSDPHALASVYAAMEACGMVLCFHGETPGVFCMARERTFLADLRTISQTYPKLKIVLEHITTAESIEAVKQLDNVAATITVHHLILTLDDVVGDFLQPHHFCKPIPKTPWDLASLRKVATSGHPKFFLGTDSAPHGRYHKEGAHGCAGVFTAPVALSLLTQVFEEEGALEALGDFTSVFGAQFYGLPLNEGTLDLVREPWKVPYEYHVPTTDRLLQDHPDYRVRPFRAGQELPWRVL